MSEEATQAEAEAQEQATAEPKMFDESYVKQLRDEAAGYRVKLKEIEDRDKSEAQKQQEALEQAQKELADLTIAKTRAEVAAAKGVPVELLQGGTKEDLEAYADALIKYRGSHEGESRKVANTWDRPSKNMSVADQFADWSASTFN